MFFSQRAAIAGVKAGTVSLEQAKTIGDLSQVVVNLAKVEVAHARATEGRSRFLADADETPQLPNGVVGITRHLIGK